MKNILRAKIVAGCFYMLATTIEGFSQNEVQNPGGGAGNFWKVTGNNNTVDGTNFIGTVDNIPFNIRINDQKAGRITNELTGHTHLGYKAAINSTGTNNTAIGLYTLGYNGT